MLWEPLRSRVGEYKSVSYIPVYTVFGTRAGCKELTCDQTGTVGSGAPFWNIGIKVTSVGGKEMNQSSTLCLSSHFFLFNHDAIQELHQEYIHFY